MIISRLSASNFRLFKDLEANFSPGVNVVFGANGQGKTSLAEAAYFISQGKSFRSPALKDITRVGSRGPTVVSAVVSAEDGDKEIRIEFQQGKKDFFLNRNKISQASEFFGQLASVVFTPDELKIVQGTPQLRRSFIDRLACMCDPKFVDVLVSYQRALKNRNLGLKQDSLDDNSLMTWAELLARFGSEIAKRRYQVVNSLQHRAKENFELIAKGRDNLNRLSYESSFIDDNNQPLDQEKLLENYLSNLERDRQARTTTVGVHRDKLEFDISTEFGCHSARGFASQGQARTIAIAATLASADIYTQVANQNPVVILDDIDSELDDQRLEALLTLVKSSNRQTIITTTDTRLIEKLGLNSSTGIHLEGGRIV